MKKFVTISILCGMFLSITGCGNSNLELGNETILNDEQKTNVESAQGVEKKDDFDADKEVIVPKKTTVTEVVYEEVIPYLNDRIVVKQAGRYGIIDNKGEIVMPITQLNPIEPLNTNSVMFVENNKLGVLSTNGDILLPAIYDDIYAINEDLIRLETNDIYIENGQMYRDINGTQHDVYCISNKCFIGETKVGGYEVDVKATENVIILNYNTAYNYDGEVLCCADESIEPLEYEGNTYLVLQKQILDKKGNVIYSLLDSTKEFSFSSSDKILIKEPYMYNAYREYYNYYTFDLNDLQIEPIENIPENVTICDVKDNGFYEIYQWPEGIYKVYRGLMNNDFQIIVEPIYESIGDYINGYFPIELNDYIGYVDEKGNVVQPTIDIDDLQDFNKFAYRWTKNNGVLINPSTGKSLPYEKADLIDDSSYYYEKIESKGIYEAILTDENTGEKYKSFVTWEGPIVDHKFPNAEITVSRDGKVAVYNKGAAYTIVELE